MNEINIRTFKIYWLTGEVEKIEAEDTGSLLETLGNAMSNAGIGNGALRALDYWEETTQKEDITPNET